MRKLLVLLGLGIGAGFVLRRFGGRLGERLQATCEGMMARMGEQGPPAKIIGGIEEIRDQNRRIMALLEKRLSGDGPAPEAVHEPADEPSEG